MPVLHCSFCNRSEANVFRLIHGPDTLHICNLCVRVCVDILGETRVLHELVHGRKQRKRASWWASGYRWRMVRDGEW